MVNQFRKVSSGYSKPHIKLKRFKRSVLATDVGVTNNSWIFDSGGLDQGLDHFTKHRDLLIDDRVASVVVMASDKVAMNIVAIGFAHLKPKCWLENAITVNNVKLIPTMPHNFVSVSQIVRRGHELNFTNQGVFQGHEDRRVLSFASSIGGWATSTYKVNTS